MPEPDVTVVIPCLNAAHWLPAALDSVQSQRGVATDIVVVDGGSHDGTVELLESRPGIRFVSEPDRGLSDAVNKGVSMAHSDRIGWLNADDTYTRDCLVAVQRAWSAAPSREWLTGYCRIVAVDGHEIRRPITAYKNSLLRHYSHQLHLTHNFVSAPSTFFTRQAFMDVGGLDESLGYSMDYDLYLRLGRRGPPVVLPQVLANFTAGGDSLSATGFEKQFVEHHEVASRYREDARVPVAINALTSRGITASYHVMRSVRRLRERAAK